MCPNHQTFLSNETFPISQISRIHRKFPEISCDFTRTSGRSGVRRAPSAQRRTRSTAGRKLRKLSERPRSPETGSVSLCRDRSLHRKKISDKNHNYKEILPSLRAIAALPAKLLRFRRPLGWLHLRALFTLQLRSLGARARALGAARPALTEDPIGFRWHLRFFEWITFWWPSFAGEVQRSREQPTEMSAALQFESSDSSDEELRVQALPVSADVRVDLSSVPVSGEEFLRRVQSVFSGSNYFSLGP